MDCTIENDAYWNDRMGFPPITNRTELFNSPPYEKYRTQVVRRDRQFSEKNTEGSEGKCSCGSTNTFAQIIQGRSGDEMIDMYIVCGDCQKKWRAK